MPITEKKSFTRAKRKSLKSARYDKDIASELNGSDYDVITKPSSQLTYQFMADYISNVAPNLLKKDLNDIRILDWGCGKGHVSYLLSKKGAKEITYCEVDNYPHRQLWPQNKTLKYVPLKHDWQLPFKDSDFDIVLSVGVLEHVPFDYKSLEEISRVLQPKGVFMCFNLPSSMGWIHRVSHLRKNYYHDRLYSKKEVKNLLKRAGLKPLHIWRRQLFPKLTVNYSHPVFFEKLDNFLTTYTPLRLFATSIEFIAVKQTCHTSEQVNSL